MRKTRIPNKLSTNRKPIHGGQRVCEENKLELEKNETLLKYFVFLQMLSQRYAAFCWLNRCESGWWSDSIMNDQPYR